MDIDLHYYGTYALARAAGLDPVTALNIATAAEFVDDSTDDEVIVHPDGARFRGESTAHHPTDLAPINDRDDQVMVWIPFHFLPGAEGETQSQKLVCRKNSEMARAMVDHHLAMSDAPYAVELMGITAHVYADTFAHYGFSGVSSRVNRVKGSAIKLLNADPNATTVERFFAKFGTQGGLIKNFRTRVMSDVAEVVSGALGHGAVATFPDQPYLEWSYSYEMPDEAGQTTVERQNANDYLEGARALYGMFRRFVNARSIFADEQGPREFEEIELVIRSLATLTDGRQTRINAWKTAIADCKFSRSEKHFLPDYSHLEWRRETDHLATLETPQAASGIPVYRFHQAAAMHRHYVLRQLLPKNGIYVI